MYANLNGITAVWIGVYFVYQAFDRFLAVCVKVISRPAQHLFDLFRRDLLPAVNKPVSATHSIATARVS